MCALAATDQDDSSGHLAYPGSTHVGELNIFDTVNLRAVTSITAHDNPIGKILKSICKKNPIFFFKKIDNNFEIGSNISQKISICSNISQKKSRIFIFKMSQNIFFRINWKFTKLHNFFKTFFLKKRNLFFQFSNKRKIIVIPIF